MTTCILCEERPANKSGMCQSCFISHWNKEFWRKKRAEHEDRQRQISEAKEQERRDFLNMYQGAQKALLRLQKAEPGMDYTSALNDCQKRIQELQEQTR